jgi:hypothetical protein
VEADVFTFIGIGMVAMATVFLVLGLVTLLRCDRDAIPETVRALSFWLRHSYPTSWPTDYGHRATRLIDDVHSETVPLNRKAAD